VKSVNIDRKKNTALVTLNSKVYKIDNILKVAQTFTGACWVNVDGDVEGVVRVSLRPKSKDISVRKVGYEFFNHVLAEMKLSKDA